MKEIDGQKTFKNKRELADFIGNFFYKKRIRELIMDSNNSDSFKINSIIKFENEIDRKELINKIRILFKIIKKKHCI